MLSSNPLYQSLSFEPKFVVIMVVTILMETMFMDERMGT